MNKFIAQLLVVLGIIFLAIPLASDSYSHYLQDNTYKAAQEQIVTCRANLALEAFTNHSSVAGRSLLNTLDSSCGTMPHYDDYSYTQTGILSLYNWIGNRVSFIPL